MFKVLIWTFWTRLVEDSQPPNWVEYAHDLETAELLATERPRASFFEVWFQGVQVSRGKRNKYGYWSIETEEPIEVNHLTLNEWSSGVYGYGDLPQPPKEPDDIRLAGPADVSGVPV